jgi:hypothetical protein
MIFGEAFLPAARRLFHHRIRLPIADAHYAMGFGFLHQVAGAANYFDRMVHFLDVLEQSRCPGFSELLLGLSFRLDHARWHDPKGHAARLQRTPYAYEAFLQAYRDRTASPMERDYFVDCAPCRARYKSFPTSQNGSSSSYTPFDGGGVINAAAYRAFLLTSASEALGRDDYRAMAERNLRFVLENSEPGWVLVLRDDGVRDFVDHFHTCFVLKALARLIG